VCPVFSPLPDLLPLADLGEYRGVCPDPPISCGTRGNLTIYACGIPWLMVALGVDAGRAISLGLVPFLIGDAIKILFAAVLLPEVWRLVGAWE